MNEHYEVVKNVLGNLVAHTTMAKIKSFGQLDLILVRVNLTDFFSTWTKLNGARKLVL